MITRTNSHVSRVIACARLEGGVRKAGQRPDRVPRFSLS